MFTSTINKIPNSKNETDSTTCRHENSELMWRREREKEGIVLVDGKGKMMVHCRLDVCVSGAQSCYCPNRFHI